MRLGGGRVVGGARMLAGGWFLQGLACVVGLAGLAGCGSIIGYESDYRVVDAAGGRSGAAGQGGSSGGASSGGNAAGGRAGQGGGSSGGGGASGKSGSSGSGAAGGNVVGGAGGSVIGGAGGSVSGGAGGSVSGGAGGSVSGGAGGSVSGGAGGSVSGGAGGSPPVDEDPCAASTTCGVLYVSASTGDDAADGCSLAKPLRTVDAAVKKANANATVSCVSACVGTYATKGISVTRPYVLRGARDCVSGAGLTWYGQNGNPPAEATNIVVAGGAGPVGVTLAADGAKLEDLQIAWSFPATDDAATVAAVRVEKKATLVDVAALVLDRGMGLTPRASAGILVVSGGDPGMRGTYGAGAGQLAAPVPTEPSAGLRVEPGGRFGVTESTFVGGAIRLASGALPTSLVSVGVWDRSGVSTSTYGLVATAGEVRFPDAFTGTGALLSAGYWLEHVHNSFNHARLAGGAITGKGRTAAIFIAPTAPSLPSDKVEIVQSRLSATVGIAPNADSVTITGGRVVVKDSVLYSPPVSGQARLVAATNEANVDIARSTLVGGKVAATGGFGTGGTFRLVHQSGAATAKLTDVLLVSLGLAGSPLAQSLANCDAATRSTALGSLSLDHVTVLAPRGSGPLLSQATVDEQTSCAAFANVDDASAALAAAGTTPVSFGWLTSTKTAGGGVQVPGCLDDKAEDCAGLLLQDPLAAGAALSKSSFAPTCDALVVYPNQLSRSPNAQTIYDVVDKARKPGGAIGAFEPSCP